VADCPLLKILGKCFEKLFNKKPESHVLANIDLICSKEERLQSLALLQLTKIAEKRFQLRPGAQHSLCRLDFRLEILKGAGGRASHTLCMKTRIIPTQSSSAPHSQGKK